MSNKNKNKNYKIIIGAKFKENRIYILFSLGFSGISSFKGK